MYDKILVGLDGSQCGERAGSASLALAKAMKSQLMACHVYAAAMHRARFNEMELGLPARYQQKEKLEELRGTHEDIISDGMKIISDAHLASFGAKASQMGLEVKNATPEGKNYVEFLKTLDLTHSELAVIGTEGLGKVPEVTLGSFAERVLLFAKNKDVLLVRGEWNLKGRPIVVGVDGSEHSYAALRKAVGIALRFGSSVKAVAVYDPFFHTGVFSSISSALTNEQSNRFNFPAQERLHDEIIDDGLRTLYGKRVDKGLETLGQTEVNVEKVILTGKVFAQLAHYASTINAGLIVVGRFGVNRADPSLIGSTPQVLARIAPTSVLVVDGGPTPNMSFSESGSQSQMIRPETDAKGENSDVTGRTGKPQPMTEALRDAEIVVLRKAKKMAPAFHEHIVRSKLPGNTVEVGTRFMVFDVIETSPPGKVIVTPNTRLEFVR